MKSEKEKLLEEFEKLYFERLAIKGWEKRQRATQMMMESAKLIFESILKKSNKLIDSSNLELNDKWWVFEAKPNSGKTTMMIDVLIPVMTSILVKRKIFSIWVLVNPSSNILKEQCNRLCQQMIDSTDNVRIKLHDTDGAENIRTTIRTIKHDSNFYKTSSSCIILTNHPMINAGYDEPTKKAKGCKPLIKKLLQTIVQNVKYGKKGYEISLTPLHDECKVSSCSKPEISKYSSKISFNTNITFMPSIIELYNSVMSDIDYFNLIGYDGTPKYHMSGKAPKVKQTTSLFPNERQDNNYSKLIEYGGPEDIWKVKKMEKIPVSEDTLHESYYAGMATKPLSDFYSLLLQAVKSNEKLNNTNSTFAKKNNEELKKYGIKVDNKKRMLLVACGNDIDDGYNVNFERGEKIAKFLEKNKIPHTVWFEDMCYHMDSSGIKHYVGEDDEIENIVDIEGTSRILLLKRKRMTGWNATRIESYLGSSEHTDMMPNHPTAKPLQNQENAVCRSVRLYTAFVDLDDNPITPTQIAKIIGELKKNKKFALANDIRDLVIQNNKFEVYYVDSSGYDGVKKRNKSDANGIIDAWLRSNYSTLDMFIEKFDNEINKTSMSAYIELEDCSVCNGTGKVPKNIHFVSEEEQEEKLCKEHSKISEKIDEHLGLLN